MRGQGGPIGHRSQCHGNAWRGREGCRTHREPGNIPTFPTPNTISNPFFKPTAHSDPLPGQRHLSFLSCNLGCLEKCSFIQNLLQSCSLIFPPALLLPTKMQLSTDTLKTFGEHQRFPEHSQEQDCKAVKKMFRVSSSTFNLISPPSATKRSGNTADPLLQDQTAER